MLSRQPDHLPYSHILPSWCRIHDLADRSRKPGGATITRMLRRTRRGIASSRREHQMSRGRHRSLRPLTAGRIPALPAEAPTDQGAFRLALRRGLGSACGGSGTPAMAAIHSAAELEALKALLAAGLSRSEAGPAAIRAVLAGSSPQAQGRRAAAFKARAKAEDHHAAEAVADHRIRTAHCHRRTIARTGRQCLPMAGRRRRSRHAVLRRRSRRQLARVVLSASCVAQRCGRGAGNVCQGAVEDHGLKPLRPCVTGLC